MNLTRSRYSTRIVSRMRRSVLRRAATIRRRASASLLGFEPRSGSETDDSRQGCGACGRKSHRNNGVVNHRREQLARQLLDRRPLPGRRGPEHHVAGTLVGDLRLASARLASAALVSGAG